MRHRSLLSCAVAAIALAMKLTGNDVLSAMIGVATATTPG